MKEETSSEQELPICILQAFVNLSDAAKYHCDHLEPIAKMRTVKELRNICSCLLDIIKNISKYKEMEPNQLEKDLLDQIKQGKNDEMVDR